MAKYKVGDRVRVVNVESTLTEKGECGTIVFAEISGMIGYGVRMDKARREYHTCNGRTDENHGQWLFDKNIELVYSRVPKNAEHEFKVIITSKGDTTTAKLMHGKEVAREVKVNRYYKDEYSEEAAIAAIMDKLFPLVLPKEQPKKYFTGRVVCIKNSSDSDRTLKPNFRVGYIYCINDGALGGERYVAFRNIDSVKHLNKLCKFYKFIELKG